jgi:hypothetical protein
MSKNLNIRAQKATQEIFDILGVRPSGPQSDKVAQAIEQVIVKALNKSIERSTDAVREVCSADLYMAQRVAREVRQANNVLIANLSAMR